MQQTCCISLLFSTTVPASFFYSLALASSGQLGLYEYHPFHARFAAAIHGIGKGNGFVPHSVSFERRQRGASPSSKGWDFIPNTYGDERILE